MPGHGREGEPRARRAAGVHRRRRILPICTAASTSARASTTSRRAFDASKYGEISAEPYLDITIPVAARSVAVPAGPARDVGLRAVRTLPARRVPTGPTARDQLATTVVRTLERYAPGIWNAIEHRQVLTPVDLEETYGLTGGHIHHGEPSLDQLFTMRPMLGWAQYRTPIDGLFLCGAGTHPGGGDHRPVRTGTRRERSSRRALKPGEYGHVTNRWRGTLACPPRSRLLTAGVRSVPAGAGSVRVRRETGRTQLALERRFLALPDRRPHPRRAPVPHADGRIWPARRATASWRTWTRDRFRDAGLEDVQITTHEVLLPWPEEVSVEMIAPRPWRASMREEPIPGDPDTAISDPVAAGSRITPTPPPATSRRRWSTPAAASPPTTTGWRAQGIDVRGKIVLVRYSVRTATAASAADRAAARRRRDPHLFRSGRRPAPKGKAYPDGPWGPASHIERGGDRLRLPGAGRSADAGLGVGARARGGSHRAEAVSLPTILSAPLSARTRG